MTRFALILLFALLACMTPSTVRMAGEESPPPIQDPTKRIGPPGGLEGRSGGARARLIRDEGGTAASEAAVARGLKWLALHQAPDGRWSLHEFHKHARKTLDDTKYFDDGSTGKGMKNDTAGTAFGLLPFLAAGITHKRARGKEAPADNRYAKTVDRGLKFLLARQGKDGDLGGGMYAHGLATIALCEALALSGDRALKPPAQAAISYIIAAQHPTSGGWRYQPRQGGDTSVLGWQVMALHAGQCAGLKVPAQTLKGAAVWLDSCQAEEGGYGYVGPQRTSTMTAVGLLCRQHLGTSRTDRALLRGFEFLKGSPPGKTNNIYYEYYATQTHFHLGGEHWTYWNEGPKGKNSKTGIRDVLIAKQDRDGSWDPKQDIHGAQGGRIMQTSLALLTLEVYYRYLPLYKRDSK